MTKVYRQKNIRLEVHADDKQSFHGDEADFMELVGNVLDNAGVKKDDRLLAVDGVSTKDMSLGDVVMRLRGRPDTQVSLDVERGGLG